MSDNKFVLYSSNGTPLSDQKMSILKEEKEKAYSMIKTAYFKEGLQDPYPSPFLNLSDMSIPRRSIEIFRWCKYFYTFDPLISGAINSLATFPVTDVNLEDREMEDESTEDTPALKLYKKIFFKTINIHKLLIEIGIDYWLYGNCFIFGEMYTNPYTKEKEWKHIIRLDPSKMIIDVNPATQDKIYKWSVPEKIVQIVKTKKPLQEYVKVPEIIKQAVLKDRAVIIKPDNIYHFSRPTDSMGDSVWGTPVVANVLKLLMYRNILRQAQEAIAREHIVPFRIYYLEKTDNYNTQADWPSIAQNFAGELNKVAKDPNYKVVSPVPVNVLNIGGDGRALLLTPEIEQVQSEILAGMNMPREFIFGGISYSGSSISLKILENQFITYRLLLKDFMQNFIIKNMAKSRGEWTCENDDEVLIVAKMADLKMQDDVQQKQIVINLNSAGKITDEYMWKMLGIDPERMRKAIEKEALQKVELETNIQKERLKQSLELQKIQVEQSAQLQKYQMEMQKKYGLVPQNVQLDANGNPIQSPDMPQGQIQLQQQGQPQVPAQQQQEQSQNKQQGQENKASEGKAKLSQLVQQLVNMPDQQAQKYISQLSPESQPIVLQALREAKNQQYQGAGYQEAQKIAMQLMNVGEQERQAIMSKLPGALKDKVVSMMQELQAQQKEDDSKKIDMRPLPDQKPPRRDSLK
jgi:hypothetical protein